MSEVVQVVGLVLISVGVGLFSVPAGLIAAGICLYWVGEAL